MKRKVTEKDQYYRDAGMRLSPCQTCMNLTYLGDPTGKDSTCNAFPTGGIPNEIFIGKFNHTRPHDGDHDVHYDGQIVVLDGKTYRIGWDETLETVK